MILTRPEALLLTCIHQDASRFDQALRDGIDAGEWRMLLALATVQRVRPINYQRLVDRDLEPRVPVSVWEGFKRGSRENAERVLRLQARVAVIARALAAENIPMAALKGVYLAQEVYGNPALREMNDADILVRREDVRRTVDRLFALGYPCQSAFHSTTTSATGTTSPD